MYFGHENKKRKCGFKRDRRGGPGADARQGAMPCSVLSTGEGTGRREVRG